MFRISLVYRPPERAPGSLLFLTRCYASHRCHPDGFDLYRTLVSVHDPLGVIAKFQGYELCKRGCDFIGTLF